MNICSEASDYGTERGMCGGLLYLNAHGINHTEKTS